MSKSAKLGLAHTGPIWPTPSQTSVDLTGLWSKPTQIGLSSAAPVSCFGESGPNSGQIRSNSGRSLPMLGQPASAPPIGRTRAKPCPGSSNLVRLRHGEVRDRKPEVWEGGSDVGGELLWPSTTRPARRPIHRHPRQTPSRKRRSSSKPLPNSAPDFKQAMRDPERPPIEHANTEWIWPKTRQVRRGMDQIGWY